MTGRATGADDADYSSVATLSIDDAENSVCAGNRDEDDAIGVNGVCEIYAVRIQKAEHGLGEAKAVVARTAGELAEVLGLERADGIEIAVRSALNSKIIEVIEKRRLTHAQVASLAGTSRTRVTAIMNRNTKDISTDLMLRVLGALGVSAKITFGRAA